MADKFNYEKHKEQIRARLNPQPANALRRLIERAKQLRRR
ncbi:hypothetical protein LCGC14_1661430 [marine sediment metagenome]|uniref:Uncharacterized protein n=1 Tax=marine sediment metagenome TaxID=412755 RepID=A0A0F9IGD7_9ZZZZ